MTFVGNQRFDDQYGFLFITGTGGITCIRRYDHEDADAEQKHLKLYGFVNGHHILQSDDGSFYYAKRTKERELLALYWKPFLNLMV